MKFFNFSVFLLILCFVSIKSSICFSQIKTTADTLNKNILFKGYGSPSPKDTFILGNKIKIEDNFISASLADRIDCLFVPPDMKEKGIVAVFVVIDENGNIILIRSGAAGSTTNNKYLILESEKAAKSSLFKTSDKQSKGQIFYVFK